MRKFLVPVLVLVLACFALSQTTAQIGDIKGFKNRTIRTAFENIGSQTKTVSAVWTFSAAPTFSAGATLSGGGVTIDDDITLDNGEIIDNDTDGDVIIQYDDDAATLGEWVFYNTLDDSIFADNDLFNVHFRSLDEDSTAVNNWVTLESKILDATGNSKDSHFAVKTYAGNTQVTSLTTTGYSTTLGNGAILNNSGADSLVVTEGAVRVAGNFRVSGTAYARAAEVNGTLTLANDGTITNTHADTLQLNENAVKIKGAGGLVFAASADGLGITKITTIATAAGAERASITVGGVDYYLVAVADSADIVD